MDSRNGWVRCGFVTPKVFDFSAFPAAATNAGYNLVSMRFEGAGTIEKQGDGLQLVIDKTKQRLPIVGNLTPGAHLSINATVDGWQPGGTLVLTVVEEPTAATP